MKNNVKTNNTRSTTVSLKMLLAFLFLVALAGGIRAEAQPFVTFNSGSSGADGVLTVSSGTVYLQPSVSGNNIYNYKSITISAGATLKISELYVHGAVYLLSQGDVNINGTIDITGADSPGPTAMAAEQIPPLAGSGGYSGGLGGIHGDLNHQSFPGNGPGGGLAGDITSSSTYATGGTFTTNGFLVPLVGGSGGGGTNASSGFGSPGGAGGGAILIASTTQIVFNNGVISAWGGSGGTTGCGGSGGAVRLVSNTISSSGTSYGINVGTNGGGGTACKTFPTTGIIRMEYNTLTNYATTKNTGTTLTSAPFALNLPSAPPPLIAVYSINGVQITPNPYSFPDTTVNSPTSMPVVINATNLPVGATVTLYLLSDGSPNQAIPVPLVGTDASSTATVNVTFPAGGTRGYLKATWGTLGTQRIQPERKSQ